MKTSNLEFIDGILRQHVLFFGKTRAGKSSKMRVTIERGILDHDRPVCIVDPKGDWWGLKASADAKKPGYPVIIFGGKHADVPINGASGTAVGELVATGNRSAIIDLKGWMPGERTRFIIDFAAAFFTHTEGRRWLVFDEVQNFAPQQSGGRAADPQVGMLLHWMNRLANEGSGMGVTLISASQRPQKVNKDFVTAHETLIACRVVHPLDRGAMKEWMDGAGDEAKAKEILKGLATMPREQAWVWSPELGIGPDLTSWPLFKTFDSFSENNQAAPAALKGWASVDLDAVKERLAGLIEEAKASDPKALKDENARLRKLVEAANKDAGVPEVLIKQARENGIARGYRQGWLDGRDNAMKGGAAVMLARAQNALNALRYDDITDQVGSEIAPPPSMALLTGAEGAAAAAPSSPRRALPAPAAKGTIQQSQTSPPPSPKPAAKATRANGLDVAADQGELSPSELKILEAIASCHALGYPTPTAEQVAAWSGYSVGGGRFSNLRSGLKVKGFVSYFDSGMALTPKGKAAAPEIDLSIPVRSRLNAVLSPSQCAVLDSLPVDGAAITREQLAQASSYDAGGGRFSNLVSSLKTLGLIRYPSKGLVAAEKWVFE